MKTNKLVYFFLIAAFAIQFSSCKKKKDEEDPCAKYKNGSFSGNYSSGVFVSNQGSFGTPNGTVSYISRNGSVENGIFEAANCSTLGDVVQSLTVNNGKGYIVVNNSNKIEVVNADDFKSTGKITSLLLPRYFVALDNNKAYVSEWIQTYPNPTINGRISIINLSTNMVTSSIAVGKNPEEMIIAGGKLYVANSADSTVTVINTSTDLVENTITVGDSPRSLLQDANNDIWVLAEGKWKSDYTGLETMGKLVKFNPATPNSQTKFQFNSMYSQPSYLNKNAAGTKLYYTFDGKLYDHDINASALSSSPLINRYFDNFGIDPTNNFIYAAKSNSNNKGWVLRYNASATLLDSFQVGIFPSEIYFR